MTPNPVRLWEIGEIESAFRTGLEAVAGRFTPVVLQQGAFWDPNELDAARPGVYVWWHGGEVLRVGRSFTNARARALQHIRDDTAGRMAALNGSPDLRLILFTVPDADAHWAASAEVYLEGALKPSIPSKRRG